MQSLQDLGSAVGALLKQTGETIAVAESSAAGLMSACLVAVPGASAYYLGGCVIYTHASRQALARIDDQTMRGMRASTEPYALLMAQQVRTLLGTTWGLAETGASGPSGNRYGDAAGHACIAVSGPLERVITLETGESDREANMWTFTRSAMELLENCLKESRPTT